MRGERTVMMGGLVTSMARVVRGRNRKSNGSGIDVWGMRGSFLALLTPKWDVSTCFGSEDIVGGCLVDI
jgi:hypothetical protein